jgi:PhzF family phenazine biosynthesis protein
MRVRKYRAFTVSPDGGNPAAVVTDHDATADEMQRIAMDIGFSETVFAAETTTAGRYHVRYFSPAREISFCGHATIAAAIAIADDHPVESLIFGTKAGDIHVATERQGDAPSAEFTTVEPRIRHLTSWELVSALEALRLRHDDLQLAFPPALTYAGAWHLTLGLRTRRALRQLDYDFDKLLELSKSLGLATAQVFWRETPFIYHSRNPFPAGGVREDPATGAAAAALAGYLRKLGLGPPGGSIRVLQGEDMGSPSEIRVRYEPDEPTVKVSGHAIAIS